METKRCAYCHKLQRADSQICRRCGRTFETKTAKGLGLSRRVLTRPTLPSASPHRAGHYSGLHPEDQPYQSSMMLAQHVDAEGAEEGHRAMSEPEQILLPSTDSAPALKVYREALQPAHPIHSAPTLEEETPTFYTPYRRKRPLLSSRMISIILTCACLIFLLASSIIVFVHISHPTFASASFKASPDVVTPQELFTLSGAGFAAHTTLTFTYDNNEMLPGIDQRPLQTLTDSAGGFSVQVRMPAACQAGRHTVYVIDQGQKLHNSTSIVILAATTTTVVPHLQLSLSSLDLQAGAPSSSSHQTITLANAGAGAVQWRATSDQSWLTMTPASGSFTQTQNVQITANRAQLTPQDYTGHIVFVQDQPSGMTPVTLTVHMSVDATPSSPSMILSTSALSYTTTAGQNPEDQTITIQNTGGKRLDLSSSIETDDGSSWLTLDPPGGNLPAHTSAVLTISIQSQHLSVGNYAGQITFSGDAPTQVIDVALEVLAPANLSVSSGSLNFTTTAGQAPSSQTLTIQNNGGVALNWTATVGQNTWLSAAPTSGTLAPGAQTSLVVTIAASAPGPDTDQAAITFTAGTQTKTVNVTLTVSAPPTPTSVPVLTPTATTSTTDTINGAQPASTGTAVSQ